MFVLYTIIDDQRDTALQDWQLAPSAYHERLQRMRSYNARARTLAGLMLLGQGLRRIGRDTAVLQRIGYSTHGRPEIAGGPAFSISHSGALVACAISDTTAVGLDVEARRPLRAGRLSRLLSEYENMVVASDPNRFFDYWCAREAAVKASGRVGLARIRQVQLWDDRARLDGQDWPLQALDLAPGYAACLTHGAPTGAVVLEEHVIGSNG